MAQRMPGWEERSQNVLQMLQHVETQLYDIKNELLEHNRISCERKYQTCSIYDPPESLDRRFRELMNGIDADIGAINEKRVAITKIYELYKISVKPLHRRDDPFHWL